MNSTIEDILETDKLYNPKAARMLYYVKNESNRIRAYKMALVAKRLEERFRKHNCLWIALGIKKEVGFIQELEYNTPSYIKVNKVFMRR